MTFNKKKKKKSMKQEIEKKEKYLTTHQAAKVWWVTPITAIKWAKEKKFKCIKTLGGHRRIPLSEVVRIRKIMEDPDFDLSE